MNLLPKSRERGASPAEGGKLKSTRPRGGASPRKAAGARLKWGGATAFRLILWWVVWLGVGAPAEAHWNKEWTVRKKVTLKTSTIAEPIGNAVVLLRLHDGTFQFPLAKEDGSDLRVLAADDKTLLPYHLEKYDALLNEAFVWVRVPELKPGADTELWLYYGNTGPTGTRVEEAKATYDAETVLVYHFGERGQPPADSTGHGHNGSRALSAVEGALIGAGGRANGTDFTTAELPAWNGGDAATWSLWVKPTALPAQAVLLARREGEHGLVLSLENGVPTLQLEGQRSAPGAPLAVNTWRHLAVVAAAGKVSLYVEGELYASLAGALPALNAPLQIGGADGAAGFTGELDELQVASVARPAGWLRLAAQGQGGGPKADALVSMAPDEESGGGGHSGYFTVIVNSLTFDGWVVIGILAVMFAISWWLMITKVRYLNALSRGNALFMREWVHVAADLTALDHGDPEKVKTLGGRAMDKKAQRHLRTSSVYRLYHVGAEEIRHRVSSPEKGRILSSRSIQSIRATLDGAQVREKQRIDKLIVLLTICISGGPFLGLLGTVVGVMITFAAVAAAGDVNVNAIAPGIAAALLATVAGLAVAIPALFGYNYILARVKDATADMHVFIDEFITKMAEFYSEPPSGSAV